MAEEDTKARDEVHAGGELDLRRNHVQGILWIRID